MEVVDMRRLWPLMALLACGGTAETPEAAEETCGVGLNPGQCPPDEALLDPAGSQVHLSDWEGERMLLVGSSTWCGACARFMASLNETLDGPPEGFEVINVLVQGVDGYAAGVDDAVEWRDQLGLEFPVLADNTAVWSDAWDHAGEDHDHRHHSYTVIDESFHIDWHVDETREITPDDLIEAASGP
jgi:peroxiredoxin